MSQSSWKLEAATPAPGNVAVLVWNGETIAVGRKMYDTWGIDESFGFNEDGHIYDVTHWMELPEAPK